jgi:type VI secretion system protein ImpG
LYQLLCRRLKRIIVSAPGAETLVLPAGCLKQAGYGENDSLVPWPPHAFPGYRLLQEYFTATEKFLFFELAGLDRWTGRGDAGHFNVSFLLDGLTSEAPKAGRANFVTNAVPAVNLFAHDADPILLDHRASRHLVRPCGANPRHYRIFSVDGVTGISRDTGIERNYAAFELFGSDTPATPVYHAGLERSPVGDGYDVYLCTAFPDGTAFPVEETLSIALTCTNDTLPDSLRIGDIRTPESGIPATVSFSNITPVHPEVPPPSGPELLWRLTTHLFLNHVTLGNAEHLRTLLKLYLPHATVPGSPLTANLKRVAGIEDVAVTPDEAMVEGVPVRGNHIRLKVCGDHFAGAGDLYLFGCVLDRFLAEYSSLNHFTRLTIEEPRQGEICQWPMRQE